MVFFDHAFLKNQQVILFCTRVLPLEASRFKIINFSMNAIRTVLQRLMNKMAPQHQQTKGTDDLLLRDSQSSKLVPTADDISENFAEDPPYIRGKFNQMKLSDRDKSEMARRIMMQLDEANEVDEEDNEGDSSEASDLSNKYDYYEPSHPLLGAKKWKWVAEITLVLLALLITAATWAVLSGTQESNQVAQVRSSFLYMFGT
jgi:hypothetical protein